MASPPTLKVVRASLVAFVVGALGVASACGGSEAWNGTGGTSGGACMACLSDTDCQVCSNAGLFCCDLTATVNGMGTCYSPPAPAVECPVSAGTPAVESADAGEPGPADAGAVNGGNKKGNPRGKKPLRDAGDPG